MIEKRSARERLIVALDCPSLAQAANLVDELGDDVLFYKIGWRLFLQGGMDFVEEMRRRYKDVFLDLKIDDIEETVEKAVEVIGEEAMFMTVQGSPATARAARQGRGDRQFPKILFVTMLSSLNEEDLKQMFGLQGAVSGETVNEYVLRRAEMAFEAGADGLIASGDSVRALRQKLGPKPLIVTPGIRPSGSSVDDHKRASTPGQAIRNGADFLVVGRPIRLATDPKAAVAAILGEMDSALAEAQA